MSRTLEALIKVHQHQVDEQRRVVTQLEEARLRTVQAIEDLKQDMEIQRNVARDDFDSARGLPAYLENAIGKDRSLNYQLDGLAGMIEAAREELQNRFADLKKYELANEAEREAERQRLLALENAALDETASQRAERNKS